MMTATYNSTDRFVLEVQETDGTWKKVASSNRADSSQLKELSETYGWMQNVRITDTREAEMKAKAEAEAKKTAERRARLDHVSQLIAKRLVAEGYKVEFYKESPGLISLVDGVSVSVGIDYPYARYSFSTVTPRLQIRVNWDKAVNYPEKKDGSFNLDKAMTRIKEGVNAKKAAHKRDLDQKAKKLTGRLAVATIAEGLGKQLDKYSNSVTIGKRVTLGHNDYGSLNLSVSGMDAETAQKFVNVLKDNGLLEV